MTGKQLNRPRPTMRGRGLVILGVMGLTLLISVAISEADWIVMTDGSHIETSGPWEVKGNLVVFSLPNGNLASLRVTRVDVGASAEISMAAKQAAAAPTPQSTAPEKKKATFVLTDDDFPQNQVDEVAPDEDGGIETSGDVLVVTTWNQADAPDGDGLMVTGTLRNQSSSPAAGITLVAILYDADGIVLVEGEAQLNSRSLAAQGRTNFRIDLPNVFSFAAIRFEVDAMGLATPDASQDTGLEEAETAPLETVAVSSPSAVTETQAESS